VNYTAWFALRASAAAVASVDYAILSFCARKAYRRYTDREKKRVKETSQYETSQYETQLETLIV